MKIELTEINWLDEQTDCSFGELAECSGLSEVELLELVRCGVIAPRDRTAMAQEFAGHSLTIARTAARLRDDFEIDLQGVALAMTLLDRIEKLETELNRLRAHMPP